MGFKLIRDKSNFGDEKEDQTSKAGPSNLRRNDQNP